MSGNLLRLLALALLLVPGSSSRGLHSVKRGAEGSPGLPCQHEQAGVMVRGTCEFDCRFNDWELRAGHHLQFKQCPEEDGWPQPCCPEMLRDEFFGEDECARWLFNEHFLPERRANGSISQRKCREYAHLACSTEFDSFPTPSGVNDQCTACTEHIDALVWHGTDAKPGQFPHMALLLFDNPNNTCSGSLVSDRHVLTAAHCTTNTKAGPVRSVSLGGVFRRDRNAKTFSVMEVIRHPNYVISEGLYDDLAVLVLNETVRLDATLRPACLHTQDDEDTEDLVHQNGTVAGWGRTELGDDVSPTLRYVSLPFAAQAECADKYKSSQPRLVRGLASTQICAGGVEKTDVDKGDSGGALMTVSVDPYCSYRLVGITSSGAMQPGEGGLSVYTRVAPYLSWLESVIWPAN